jgi:NAD(P)-dependent dehydrogenase (short-subunit alcohol dehydrogenase family)
MTGKKLAGKTAVVTGGATGIGLGVARALADEGCRVAIAGRRRDALDAAVAEYRGDPPLTAHPLDVADRASVADFFRWAHQELGRIDILVNSAGINVRRRTMAETDPLEWDRVLAVNATGVFNCMREVLPGMKEREDGLIVTISSISGLRASLLGGTAYCASKFAVTALTTAVALEYGKYGIRLTNVCPGEVDTPILENRPKPLTEEHRSRILRTEDIGAAVLMIALLPPRAHVTELVIKPTWQDFA